MAEIIIITDELRNPICIGDVMVLQHEVEEKPGVVQNYHKPTVEDLLFSYGQSCIRASNEAETDAAKQTMLARLREDYAAKLRLADDGEEQ